MKRKVVDGNGFLVYHHAKRSKQEVTRSLDVGPFVTVLLPETRTALYAILSLQTKGRLAQTCRVMARELKGLIWLPAPWRTTMSYPARTPFERTAMYHLVLDILLPRRFFQRVTRVCQLTRLDFSYTGVTLWDVEEWTCGSREGARISVEIQHPDNRAVCLTRPEHVEAFIKNIEKRVQRLADEARVPLELRQERTDTYQKHVEAVWNLEETAHGIWKLVRRDALQDVARAHVAEMLLRDASDFTWSEQALIRCLERMDKVKARLTAIEEEIDTYKKVK